MKGYLMAARKPKKRERRSWDPLQGRVPSDLKTPGDPISQCSILGASLWGHAGSSHSSDSEVPWLQGHQRDHQVVVQTQGPGRRDMPNLGSLGSGSHTHLDSAKKEFLWLREQHSQG